MVSVVQEGLLRTARTQSQHEDAARKRVAGFQRACIGFSYVRTLTHCAREEVPELMINNLPLKAGSPKAALRPLTGPRRAPSCSRASRLACASLTVRPPRCSRGLPLRRRTANASVCGGYQPIGRTHSSSYTTPTSPVVAGGVGPHPVREPGPV